MYCGPPASSGTSNTGPESSSSCTVGRGSNCASSSVGADGIDARSFSPASSSSGCTSAFVLQYGHKLHSRRSGWPQPAQVVLRLLRQ